MSGVEEGGGLGFLMNGFCFPVSTEKLPCMTVVKTDCFTPD
jgi:hypothetical protein